MGRLAVAPGWRLPRRRGREGWVVATLRCVVDARTGEAVGQPLRCRTMVLNCGTEFYKLSRRMPGWGVGWGKMFSMSELRAAEGRRGRTRSADVGRELLVAAEGVLAREGPGGLTVRAVAAEAGIAPMGVYNHLGGKDGLVEALLVRGFDRLRAAVEPGGEPGVLERLGSSQCRYREFALANPHLYAMMFENAVSNRGSSPAYSEHAVAAFTVLVRTIELAAAGGVIAAPEPRAAAQQIWSAVHGAVTLELKGLIQVPDPEAAFRALVSTLLRGLAQTPALPTASPSPFPGSPS
jgi:AcrR family transcriptional regulator